LSVVDVDRSGIMPEAFQVIKFSLFVIENMNNYVIKVKKNPHALLESFGIGGVHPFGPHLLFYGLGQPLDMPG
jgi:hypothetical protein